MILYGASGHAKVIIDILNACGIKIDKIFDDNFSQIKILHGINVCKPESSNEKMIISIGNNNVRKRISESGIAREYGTAIHPSAIVSPFAEIGEGTVIMQGAIIQAGSVVCTDIPDCAIAGGHPAKAFKYRDKEHYYKLKDEKKFH